MVIYDHKHNANSLDMTIEFRQDASKQTEYQRLAAMIASQYPGQVDGVIHYERLKSDLGYDGEFNSGELRFAFRITELGENFILSYKLLNPEMLKN